MKQILVVLTFFYSLYTVSSQNKEVIDSLYKKREYKKVVSILTKKNKNTQLTLKEYYLIARSLGKLRKFNNGLAYTEKMMKLALEQKDTTFLLKAFNLKAENLIDLRKIKEGVKFCDSVTYFFRKKDSIEFQKLCFKWGMLAYHNNDYKKAYYVYNKITKKEYRNLSLFKINYALTLEGLKKYDEAIKSFQEEVNNNLKTKNRKEILVALVNIASIYNKKKDYSESVKYLDSAKHFMSDKVSLVHRKFFLNTYYKYFLMNNNLDSAKAYLNKVESVNEDIFSKKINEEIEVLKQSHEREKELLQVIQKEKEKRFFLEKNKLKKSVFSLLGILFLGAILFYYRYKGLLLKYESLKLEQDVLQAQITPHFIFNSFSVLKGMVLGEKIKVASQYIDHFSRLMRRTLSNSRNELILLSEDILGLENYIELEHLKSGSKINFFIETDLDLTDFLIPPMLIQPFIENSIKHAFNSVLTKPVIKLLIYLENDNLRCVIQDNGIGINESKINRTKSFGIAITEERLIRLSKKYKTKLYFTIERGKELKGTIVKLNLPNRKKHVKNNNS